MNTLSHQFAHHKDRAKAQERHHWLIRNRREEEKLHKERQADKLETEIQELGVAIQVATSQRITRLQQTQTELSTATTGAIMLNREELEKVHEILGAFLDRAYTMEDGRRVFRTRDGSAVYDEFGELVSPDELDPELIDPTAPHWEDYQPYLEKKNALLAEQDQLLAYQNQLDAAEDALAGGDMTDAQADALEADLMDAMPPAVAAQMPGYDAQGTRADAATATPTTAHNTTSGPPVWEPPVLGQ